MKTDKRTNRIFGFHEKSNAWRILRPQWQVNTMGGTPWEPQHFETEAECLKHIETLPTYKLTAEEEKKLWGIK